jgi:hypothetical protein
VSICTCTTTGFVAVEPACDHAILVKRWLSFRLSRILFAKPFRIAGTLKLGREIRLSPMRHRTASKPDRRDNVAYGCELAFKKPPTNRGMGTHG